MNDVEAFGSRVSWQQQLFCYTPGHSRPDGQTAKPAAKAVRQIIEGCVIQGIGEENIAILKIDLCKACKEPPRIRFQTGITRYQPEQADPNSNTGGFHRAWFIKAVT